MFFYFTIFFALLCGCCVNFLVSLICCCYVAFLFFLLRWCCSFFEMLVVVFMFSFNLNVFLRCFFFVALSFSWHIFSKIAIQCLILSIHGWFCFFIHSRLIPHFLIIQEWYRIFEFTTKRYLYWYILIFWTRAGNPPYISGSFSQIEKGEDQLTRKIYTEFCVERIHMVRITI